MVGSQKMEKEGHRKGRPCSPHLLSDSAALHLDSPLLLPELHNGSESHEARLLGRSAVRLHWETTASNIPNQTQITRTQNNFIKGNVLDFCFSE